MSRHILTVSKRGEQSGFTTLILLAAFIGSLAPEAPAQIFLPGVQPGEGQIKFLEVAQCAMCHGSTRNGDADPLFSWQSGMMSQSMHDPIFRAALAIANQDIKGGGEFCLRCHTPRGFVAGRVAATDGSMLSHEDLTGVSCEVCHRMFDPRSQQAKWTTKHVPPGYGNAMLVFDAEFTMRGPYAEIIGVAPHRIAQSRFLAQGNFCGSCHDVSNPLFADDVAAQPPYEYGHIERTFSEWALGEYAQRGEKGTCQSCHYERLPGGGYTTVSSKKKRDYFVPHGAVGGATWVRQAIVRLWDTKDVNREALLHGEQRARNFLKTAAKLDLTFPAPGKCVLRVTNLTGHKLFTGYTEGRRMWINARFLDEAGAVLQEIGRYGDFEDQVLGEKITAQTLLDPKECRVYECLPALSPEQAAKHGKQPGPSFHFILNDVIAFDNRIPPRGFSNATFAERHCEPIGVEYADGQYWDDVELTLPPGTAKVAVRLMYQAATWEYLIFLVEANASDDWGRRLFEAYKQTGYGPPELMAEITASP